MLDDSIPLRIAIYTRVSTDEQARGGYSLDDQLEKLRTYVSIRDAWTVVGEYVDDGYTGKNIRRPQYKQMFEDIDNWNAILVMKTDRIHRNVANALKMFEQDLEKKDKYFISFTENIDTTTAMGRAMMVITMVFAQLESDQTGERTYSGMRQKAKQKGYTGHRACVGFKAIPEIITDPISGKSKTKSHLEPIPKDLAIVKEIYELYNEGLSMPQIADRFKGVTVQSVNKTKPIVLSTIQYILKNPLYVGYYKWHDVIKKADDIEPIISHTLWDLVQKRKCREADRGEYIPLLIKDKDIFEIAREKIKDMPAIRRSRHRVSY